MSGELRKGSALRCLDHCDAIPVCDSEVSHAVEQHGLSNSAQAHEHQALFEFSSLGSNQRGSCLRKKFVATGKLRRRTAGAR